MLNYQRVYSGVGFSSGLVDGFPTKKLVNSESTGTLHQPRPQGKRRHIMRQLVLGPRKPWVLEGQTWLLQHTNKVVLYEEEKGGSQICLCVKAIMKVDILLWSEDSFSQL